VSITLLLVVMLGGAEPGEAVGRRGVATLASAAIPGTGQLLLGQPVRGEIMLWADAAAWTVWLSTSWLSAVREEDARLAAAVHAGADLAVRDADYYRALERYDNSDEYNEDVRREARERYPDDPDAQRRYYAANGCLGSAAWNWDSDSSRIQLYWRTRKSARAAGLGAQFALGALLLNRLVSIIDCAFFSRESALSSRFRVQPTAGRLGLELRAAF